MSHHIVLISFDALRPDHLGCYGSTRPVTPRIDELAEQSAVLLNATSPATWTLPAYYSMLSGLTPHVHGCIHHHSAYPRDDLPFSLAFGYMGENTYVPQAITAGGLLEPQFGFNRGVDSFQVLNAIGGVERELRHHLITHPNSFSFVQCNTVHDYCHSLNEANARAFLGQDASGALLDMLNEHGSFNALMAFLLNSDELPRLTNSERAFFEDQYYRTVANADQVVGSILDLIRGLDPEFWDNTTVVLTAPHGENLGETHGGRQYFFRGGPPYQELCHVPLLIKPAAHLRDQVPAGPRDGWVSTIDLLPTLLDLVDIKCDQEQFDGQSLRGLLQGDPADLEQRDLFFHTCEDLHNEHLPPRLAAHAMITGGSTKVLFNVSDGQPREVYCLARDPRETVNRLDRLPQETLDDIGARSESYWSDVKPRALKPRYLDTRMPSTPDRTLRSQAIDLDAIMTIEGLGTQDGVASLIGYAKEAPPEGLVVELGVYRGRCTAALCWICGDKRVLAIDNWSMNSYGGGDEMIAVRNLASLGFNPRVHTGVSHVVPDGVDEVGLLVIDSDHTGPTLSRELDVWMPLLRSDAVVVLDDVNARRFPTMFEVVQQRFQAPEWEKLGEVDDLVGFKRRRV